MWSLTAALLGLQGCEGRGNSDNGDRERSDGSAQPRDDGGILDSPEDAGAGRTRFTLAVLPDTQMYSQNNPEIFEAQTRWLDEQRDALQLQMVLHEGDVVNYAYDRVQWQSASDAMTVLDGTTPYVIAPGNHDYGTTIDRENAGDRSTFLHEYFPRERYESMSTFGGFFDESERVDNSYHLFSAGGRDWLILALEFGPRDAVVDWAHSVLSEHSDRSAILLTHAYLYSDGNRYDWTRYGLEQNWNPHNPRYGISAGGVNDGQELWDKLVSWHANVVAVVCGHVHSPGVARAAVTGAAHIEEMLANYQSEDEGGAGFLRLLRFDTAARSVRVETYSPWLDEYRDDPDNSFAFTYE